MLASHPRGSALKKLLSGFVALILISAVGTADAQVAHTLNGQEGVWFPKAIAERVLHDVEQRIPKLEDTVALQDKVIEHQDMVIETSSTALNQALQLNIVTLEYADTAWALYREERAANSSFLNSPMLWSLIGGVVGAGAVGLGAWAASQ